ncbi:MAG: hypothetical protein A2046_08490 [Bacteroidetes bacterium GWA2_30_7]|nr:MAG: hypothetical protein A2046_08490 [Bacteroidetes bacterium GWA2_30_7]
MTTVIILFLIIFNIINIIIFEAKLKTKNWLKTILITVSLIGYIVILTKVSTNNRKEEMVMFLQKNEKSLNSIVQYINENNIKEGDVLNDELKNKVNNLNISYYEIRDSIVFLKMYKLLFFTYGYGVAYTEKDYVSTPRNYRFMVPYSDWFKIKDNWYYYEWAD